MAPVLVCLLEHLRERWCLHELTCQNRPRLVEGGYSIRRPSIEHCKPSLDTSASEMTDEESTALEMTYGKSGYEPPAASTEKSAEPGIPQESWGICEYCLVAVMLLFAIGVVIAFLVTFFSETRVSTETHAVLLPHGDGGDRVPSVPRIPTALPPATTSMPASDSDSPIEMQTASTTAATSAISKTTMTAMKTPRTKPTTSTVSSELRPRIDASGKPACNATALGDSAYCIEDNTYPTQVIRSILRNVNVDMSDSKILARQPLDREDSVDQTVCPAKRKTIYPKSAQNAEKKWLYVVNDVEYAQAVITEVCAQEDTACEFVSNGLPPGYTSACRQKFAYRKLLALHPTDKKAYADNFPFPSCCVCYVKSPPLSGRSLPRSRRT